jgi:hypothetical protein
MVSSAAITRIDISSHIRCGIFFALQINLFSFFSISEHIVFALEVLPLAITASIMIIVIPVAAKSGRVRRERRRQKEIQTGKLPFYKDGALWFLVLWFFGGAFWLWLTTSLSGYVGGAEVALFGILGFSTPQYLRLPYIVASYVMINALIYTFASGYETADRYRNYTSYADAVTSNTGTTNAKLVRSGERGVLFYEETSNGLVFLPWSEIKKISASKGSFF